MLLVTTTSVRLYSKSLLQLLCTGHNYTVFPPLSASHNTDMQQYINYAHKGESLGMGLCTSVIQMVNDQCS